MTITDPPRAADTADALATDARRPASRVRVPLTLVAIYWIFVGVSYAVEMATFTRFLAQTGVLLVVVLAFLGWWVFNKRVSGRDRLIVLAAALLAPVAGMLLSSKTLGPIPIVNGLPLVITAWALWLLVARRASHAVWLTGTLVAIFAPMLAFTAFRMNGLEGGGMADLSWRWSQTAEEKFLAQLSGGSTATQPASVTLQPGDWPGFRGADRNGVVHGEPQIVTDWDKTPPHQRWRRLTGPGWSSVAVVDGRLYTQEQRGESEAVVCLDADTGAQIWSHEEPGRFWDALSSTGPRATPTFAGGRLYAQGAKGTLQCLDPATGQKLWSRDILADAGAKLPEWGVVSSPLVVGGIVVVYAGGEAGKGLLAYKADTGDLAWTHDAGKMSYTSPQAAVIGGRQQVLFIGDQGLAALEPATGKLVWQYASVGTAPRSCQPLLVNESQLLIPLGMEVPTDLVSLSTAADATTATRQWTSRNLKPSFNDFVVHQGFIYGFDGRIFTCVDLKTGDRRWKKGRYGTGQVLLLADQGLLLVLSEDGDVVLVAASPDEHKELGRVKAIEGKTWNHPAYAHGRLYVRNAQEMACYDLR